MFLFFSASEFISYLSASPMTLPSPEPQTQVGCFWTICITIIQTLGTEVEKQRWNECTLCTWSILLSLISRHSPIPPATHAFPTSRPLHVQFSLPPQLSLKSLLLTIRHISNDISSETSSQVPLSRWNEPPFTSSHSSFPLFFTVNRIQWTYFLHIYLGDQGFNLVHHWLSSMCHSWSSVPQNFE